METGMPEKSVEALALGIISDWFYRVEHQQLGSPDIYMLVWVE